jgi:high-affinity iron transporter
LEVNVLAAGLITFREGLEAALIVGIVLGYLKKAGHPERRGIVWKAAAAAVLLSVMAALGLQWVGAEFEGRGEQIFEGVVMFLAAGLLTYMILWMRSQGQQIKMQLEEETRQALNVGQSWALFTLVFLAVLREGIETALFLSAAAFSSSPVQTLIGGLLGLAAAVMLAWLVFKASTRLDLRQFFSVTSLILIVFAAGLVARGVHEFQEVGLLPVVVEQVWDTNPILSEESFGGQVLQSLFGYNGNPSLLEVFSYVGYLLVAFWLVWFRRTPFPPDERAGGVS